MGCCRRHREFPPVKKLSGGEGTCPKCRSKTYQRLRWDEDKRRYFKERVCSNRQCPHVENLLM